MHGASRGGAGFGPQRAAQPHGHKSAQGRHAGTVGRRDVREGEGQLHVVVLHLTDLAERQEF